MSRCNDCGGVIEDTERSGVELVQVTRDIAAWYIVQVKTEDDIEVYLDEAPTQKVTAMNTRYKTDRGKFLTPHATVGP